MLSLYNKVFLFFFISQKRVIYYIFIFLINEFGTSKISYFSVALHSGYFLKLKKFFVIFSTFTPKEFLIHSQIFYKILIVISMFKIESYTRN